MEVMKKISKYFGLYFIIIFVIFNIILSAEAYTFKSTSPASSAKIEIPSQKSNSHFKQLNPNIPIGSGWVKLNDGRILFYGDNNSSNVIFNPNNDTFRKIADFKLPLNYEKHGILLPDGRVLFVGMNTTSASDEFSDVIWNLIKEDLVDLEMGTAFCKLVNEKPEYNSIRAKYYYKVREKYRKLSEIEKEKIYLPYIRKNPELLKKYNNFIKDSEFSMYGQIYNPITNSMEYTKNKLPKKQKISNLYLLSNNNILILNPDSNIPKPIIKDEKIVVPRVQMTVFNPAVNEFIENNIMLNISEYLQLTNSYLLRSGEIYYPIKGKIYNPMSGEYKDAYRIRTNTYTYNNNVKLSDGSIVFSQKAKLANKPEEIFIYDPQLNEFKQLGYILIPRANEHGIILLNNEEDILIHGGYNSVRSGYFMGNVPERRLEIFNTKTHKSILLNDRRTRIQCPILLNDGRILLRTENGIEIFKY